MVNSKLNQLGCRHRSCVMQNITGSSLDFTRIFLSVPILFVVLRARNWPMEAGKNKVRRPDTLNKAISYVYLNYVYS